MKHWLAKQLRALANWIERDEIAQAFDAIHAEPLPAALEREARANQARNVTKLTPFARRRRAGR